MSIFLSVSGDPELNDVTAAGESILMILNLLEKLIFEWVLYHLDLGLDCGEIEKYSGPNSFSEEI